LPTIAIFLVDAWLRCGPVSARHTVVAGAVLVRNGDLTVPVVEEKLRLHRAAAARILRLAD
jgi:hypothetical protein